MHEMMERLNVDPVALARKRGGDAYAEARSQCLSCGTSDKCLRWPGQVARERGRRHSCGCGSEGHASFGVATAAELTLQLDHLMGGWSGSVIASPLQSDGSPHRDGTE